jgi:hypothetical protein
MIGLIHLMVHEAAAAREREEMAFYCGRRFGFFLFSEWPNDIFISIVLLPAACYCWLEKQFTLFDVFQMASIFVGSMQHQK